MTAKATVLRFGRHAGHTVWQCPESYLRWLVVQPGRTAHFRQVQAEAKTALACADDAASQADDYQTRWDLDP